MPSFLHEALVDVFRRRPTLAFELLSLARTAGVPRGTRARIEDSTLSQPRPPERRADLVITLLARKRRRLVVIVEIQLTRSLEKRYAWPAYVVSARARFRCPACVLVITPDEGVARWAQEPIHLGPGAVLTPIVVGPAKIPRVRDVATAARAPGLAILSVIAHGRREDPRVALEIAEAAGTFASPRGTGDDEQLMLYLDIATNAIGGPHMLDPTTYPFHSKSLRVFFARMKAKIEAEARAAVEAKVRAEMEAKAEAKVKAAVEAKVKAAVEAKVKAEAKAKAEMEAKAKAAVEAEVKAQKAEAKAEVVLVILRARGIPVGVTHERRIRRCADLAELDRWAAKALTVTAARELFAAPRRAAAGRPAPRRGGRGARAA